jgi:hypothetical protein
MDPLRPFAGLIRTLWKSDAPTANQADAANASSPDVEQTREEAAGALEEASLRSRIRTRLVRVGLKDPRLAREVFVETVLTAELGEGLVRDPAFSDMVKRVADHIGADARLGGRLHSLLQALAEESPSA